MSGLSWCILVLCLGVSKGISANESYDTLTLWPGLADIMGKILNSTCKDLSPQCCADFKHYAKSFKLGETWALKMFDAGAKLPSGLLAGMGADLGYFDECLDVSTELSQPNQILGKYCIGTIPFKSGMKYSKPQRLINNPLFEVMVPAARGLTPGGETGIQFATCLPHRCFAVDMKQIYSPFGMVFYEEFCQTKASQPKLDGGSIATISVLGVIMCIMIVSTAYDAILQYFGKKTPYSIFIAFSVLTNGRKILATTESPNQISCLHGIRVISTMWVILGHRYGVQNMFPVKNYLDLFQWILVEANMFIMEATVSVDTFFLISGIVISYSYMSAVSKGTKFNIVMYYIHRYLRLTPVLAVVMVIHITLMKHLGSGPFWPFVIQRDLAYPCEEYWWKTLLYVQNYGQQFEMCVPQSWYLCIDTQLFLLSPLLLLPLKNWPSFTLSATGFLTVCSIATCFLTGWFFDLNSNIIGNSDVEQSINYSPYYYNATQTRAAPWLIGIILGYIIFTCKQRTTKLVINKKIMLFGWIISLATLSTCVFAGHDLMFDKYDKIPNAFHIAFVRPAWGVAVGFVIFACVVGYGGPINWFLSLPIFQVLSKLTFSMLSHFTILYFITARMRDTPRFSNVQMMYVSWGDLAVVLVVSLVLTLAFESPIISLEKVLFGRTKGTNSPPAKDSRKEQAQTA